MTVDRDQWKNRFVQLPHWQCPTSKKGLFIPIPDKFWVEETGPSKVARDHDAWEPEWIFSRFAGFLQCNMPGCGEVASISGAVPVEMFESYDDHDHHQWVEDQYVVKSIDPAPMPIKLPDTTPEEVLNPIKDAAKLIWTSDEAAGNHLRHAIQALMDHFGIAATSQTGSRIILNHRIVAFQDRDAENGDILLAIKWLGNSGSHPGGLTRSDVLDAFDMIEYVLENRFGTTKQELLAKVAAVNANKGPKRVN